MSTSALLYADQKDLDTAKKYGDIIADASLRNPSQILMRAFEKRYSSSSKKDNRGRQAKPRLLSKGL